MTEIKGSYDQKTNNLYVKEIRHKQDGSFETVVLGVPTKDDGENLEKYQKFIKHDGDKPKLGMIEGEFLAGIARILDYGAKKYGDEGNWRRCTDTDRYVNACLRHLYAYSDGEKNDPDTGESHLYHAACSLMFLDWFDRQAAVAKKQQSEK